MFDKTQPFGAVSGHPTGAAYEQNGNLYYANGESVEAPVDTPVETPVDAPVDAPAPKATRRR